MSKIFDALKKSQGNKSSVIARSILDDDLEFGDPGVAAVGDQPSLEGFEEYAVGPLADLRAIQVRIKTQVPLLPFAGDNSQAAEQYRIIRTKIVQHPNRPRSIVISSAESGDGKSVTAVNLAGVMALNPELNVLMMDCDLHRGSLAKYFDVAPSPGLADVLSGTAKLSDCVSRIDPFPNLFFLPAGKSQRGPADLLNSQKWSTISQALGKQFSYVFADTPPAGAVADFHLVQAAFDGVVLVVRPDHTNRMLWMRAAESVPDGRLIGVVMNCVKPWFLGRSLGYYYQYYNYSKYYQRR